MTKSSDEGVRAVITDLLKTIPAAFTGCLDLTVCNSMVAIDEIKRHRTFTCLGNERLTDLGLRIELCGEVLRALGRCPMPYPDAVRDVRIALADALLR